MGKENNKKRDLLFKRTAFWLPSYFYIRKIGNIQVYKKAHGSLKKRRICGKIWKKILLRDRT